MQRKEAEKLLAALIFDDLDEASKTELLNYLQTDNELRERLADMRMAAKVASDTVHHGPDPVLGKRRLKHLAKLAKRQSSWRTFLTTPRLAVAAAIFIIGIVGLAVLLPSLERASEKGIRLAAVLEKIEPGYDVEQTIQADTPSDSPGEQAAESTYPRRQFTFDPVARGPAVEDTGTVISGTIQNDGRSLIADGFVGITNAGTSSLSGDSQPSGEVGLTEKWASTSSRYIQPHSGMGMGGGDRGYYAGGGVGGRGGMGGYGGGVYSFPGGKGGNGRVGGIDMDNVMSGDRLFVGARTHDADIDFGGKEINLFTKPDDAGIVADGIPVGGRVEFKNGVATGIKKEGLPIDSFGVVDSDGDRRPVTVIVGKPVTVTGPELTTSLEPMKDVFEISRMPALELQTEGKKSNVVWEDTKTDTSYEYPKNWEELNKNEVVSKLKQLPDEWVWKGHPLVPEVKPPVPDHGKVVEDSRQGDVSRAAEEKAAEERDRKFGSSSEKTITNYLWRMDETKALLEKARSAGSGSSTPAGEPVNKEEDRLRQILGDIPIVGGLYHTDVGKRPLTEEEKKLIAKYYFEYRKSQPEGESDFSALLTQPELDVLYRADEQSGVDRANTLMGEDEPDLPPASRFKIVPVNPWVMAERDPLSTFALDVDTASYTLCRRYIRGGFLPPAGAVRMEEFINYFNYHYPQRTNPTFAVHADAAPSPFAPREQNLTLLKIGVKARTIGRDQRKAAHLIFVVDASASMDQPDRLPLVQRALSLLVNKLSAVDRVSLITCADEARLHLETTPARERDKILQAIGAIQPAGSTNLLAGLKLGYATARRTFAPKQINHIVLCSDGVANVGQTEAEAVLEEVAADRKQGITITCVGVGYGSYNDVFLEALANQGDGSYVFLDSARQAQRVFVEQLAATLQTVAKDARIQVDFNPNRVRRYRLIGYENRDIEDERFRDDTIDAGEVGSGQCSTALYELELIGRPSADRQEDLGTVFVRYRNVETGQIEEISSRLSSAIVRRHTVESAPRFFLAAGAARFAEILRQSEHVQHGDLMDVFRVVEQVSLALGLDRDVRELAELIRKAENLPRSP